MSFDVFRLKVNALIERAGGGIRVGFSKDNDQGKYLAKCSDGTVIIGNGNCQKVTVKWNGENHQSIVAI